MSFLSFFPLIPATTTASAAPVYHGGMIPCLGDVEPVNTQWLVKGYFPMGAVSVVAGPGGVGKGVFMADKDKSEPSLKIVNRYLIYYGVEVKSDEKRINAKQKATFWTLYRL